MPPMLWLHSRLHHRPLRLLCCQHVPPQPPDWVSNPGWYLLSTQTGLFEYPEPRSISRLSHQVVSADKCTLGASTHLQMPPHSQAVRPICNAKGDTTESSPDSAVGQYEQQLKGRRQGKHLHEHRMVCSAGQRGGHIDHGTTQR